MTVVEDNSPAPDQPEDVLDEKVKKKDASSEATNQQVHYTVCHSVYLFLILQILPGSVVIIRLSVSHH
jgi:hypothetical protein